MAITTSFSSEKKVDDDHETYLSSIIFLLRTVASDLAFPMLYLVGLLINLDSFDAPIAG